MRLIDTDANRQLLSEKDRTAEMLNFFINNGLEALILLEDEGREKFNVTPAEFFGITLSLLESYMKQFTMASDTTKFKKIFNDKKRQELVNFFDKSLFEFYFRKKFENQQSGDA